MNLWNSKFWWYSHYWTLEIQNFLIIEENFEFHLKITYEIFAKSLEPKFEIIE